MNRGVYIKNIHELSDVQSEAGVIGSLVAHPEYLLYSEQLKPNHFFDITNGCLFWAISQLYNSKIENIDAYNLMGILNTNKAVKRQIGDEIKANNLNDLLSLSQSVARHSPQEYIKIVKNVLDYGFKRTLVKNLDLSINLCFEETGAIDLYKKLQSTIDETTMEYIDSEVTSFDKIIRPLWNESRQKLLNGGTFGYKPKIESLSQYFLYELGELVLYLGKRKVGKSMLALNEATNLLNQDVGVLYIDTELRDSLFMGRLIAHLAKVPFKRVKSGEYDDASAERIEDAIKWIESKNFYHYYMPNYDKEKMYILAKRLKKNNNISFVIYDHLKTTESKDASGGYFELGNKINFLKDIICGELGYAGICLAQLNRVGDVGDSYRLEQEASAVVSMTQKTEKEIQRDGQQCGNTKFFVKANRLGEQMSEIETEYIDAFFKGYMCSFENCEQHAEIKKTPFD